jgi:hypothetical protein
MKDLKDPITKWEDAIGERLVDITMIFILFAIICCLFAPLFGPIIKKYKRRVYVMSANYEELAERDMKAIRIWLWIICIIGWILVIKTNSPAPL